MEENSSVGHLTVVKGLEYLRMGSSSRIGNLNWITGRENFGQHFKEQTGRRSNLIIGTHAAITHRHLIDCTDTVTVGAFSTVAGWGTQVLTHGVDISESRQRCAPVTIGDYCFVGTRAILLKGSALPSASVLAAGAVLDRAYSDESTLYGGVPARAIKILDRSALYFRRETGAVV